MYVTFACIAAIADWQKAHSIQGAGMLDQTASPAQDDKVAKH